MKKILALLLLTFSLVAQTQTTNQTTSTTISSAGVSTTTNVVLVPQNFAGAGGLYNPSVGASPRVTGWATYAKLIDAKSQTYFFTTEDAIPVKVVGGGYTIQVSARAGVASLLKVFGPVKIFGIIDGGGASAGLTSGGAASGGGLATIQIGHSHYHAMGGFRVLKVSNVPGTPKLYEFGGGRDW
jgi:hypothetical protein